MKTKDGANKILQIEFATHQCNCTIHTPQTWIISSTKNSLLIMCSYKLVLTITKHQTLNLKLDHNLIYLIANANVTAHNKPQRKTTMHPRTFTLFLWMFVFICWFGNFFCSSLTPVTYPWQWASSFATIFFRCYKFLLQLLHLWYIRINPQNLHLLLPKH